MKFATAAIAIVTFFGATPINASSTYGKSGKGSKSSYSYSTSTKSSKGKSSKSSCSQCSTDTLIRAQTLASLTLGTADDVVNNTEYDAFVEAVENIAGCLICTDDFIQGLSTGTWDSEASLALDLSNRLCECERLGGCPCVESTQPSYMPSVVPSAAPSGRA